MKEMIFKYIPILIPCGIGIGVVNVRLDKIECENKDIKLEQRMLREKLFDIHDKVNQIYKNISNIK